MVNKGFQKGHKPHNKGRNKFNYLPLKIISEKMMGNKSHLGIKHSKATKIKMIKNHADFSGKNNPNYGKKHPSHLKGKLNPNWQGGKTFEEYPKEFKLIKNIIRKRDIFLCQECKYTEKQLKRKLDIHHIDYNKKNNNPNNLISLCRSCHAQTNFKREDWTKYFQEKLND